MGADGGNDREVTRVETRDENPMWSPWPVPWRSIQRECPSSGRWPAPRRPIPSLRCRAGRRFPPLGVDVRRAATAIVSPDGGMAPAPPPGV